MIRITVFNNLDSVELLVSPETTIDEVIAQSGLVMDNARPSLNGECVFGRTHLPLKDFGVGDTAVLDAVANKANG